MEEIERFINYLVTISCRGSGGSSKHTRSKKGGSPGDLVCTELPPLVRGWDTLHDDLKGEILKHFTSDDFKGNYLMARMFGEVIEAYRVLPPIENTTIDAMKTICKFPRELSMRVSDNVSIICNSGNVNGKVQFEINCTYTYTFSDLDKSHIKEGLRYINDEIAELNQIPQEFHDDMEYKLVMREKENIKSFLEKIEKKQSIDLRYIIYIKCVMNGEGNMNIISSLCRYDPRDENHSMLHDTNIIVANPTIPDIEKCNNEIVETVFNRIQTFITSVKNVNIGTVDFTWNPPKSIFKYGKQYTFKSIKFLSNILQVKQIILNNAMHIEPPKAEETVPYVQDQSSQVQSVKQQILPSYFKGDVLTKMMKLYDAPGIIEHIQTDLNKGYAPSILDEIEKLKNLGISFEGGGCNYTRTSERLQIGKRKYIIYKGKRTAKFIKKDGAYINVKKL